MPKGPLSRKCQHANAEQEMHRSTESLQVPLGQFLSHEAMGKPEPPVLPQQLCWWKSIPLHTRGAAGMATSLAQALCGSVWKNNLPPCRGAHKVSQGLPTKSQLVLVQPLESLVGEKGMGNMERGEHKNPFALKVRDSHFTDGSIWEIRRAQYKGLICSRPV